MLFYWLNLEFIILIFVSGNLNVDFSKLSASEDDSISNLRCGYCHQKTQSNWHLQRHMLKHFDVKSFQCQFCSMKFKHKDSVTRHIVLKHSSYWSCYVMHANIYKKAVWLICEKSKGGTPKTEVCLFCNFVSDY